MRIDYLGLEAFVAIAEHGSFQRAAQALALSQTALSHRLRKVEADLGAPLLHRTSREVTLTGAGQALLADARRLLKELGDSYSAVKARASSRRRHLCFACLPTVAHTRLPAILTGFAAACPDVMLTVLDVPATDIAQRVQTGEAEFGVTIVSAQMPDLRVRALYDERYDLFVHERHPLARLGGVARADLTAAPMARIRSQFANRQLVDDALGESRHAMDWRFVVQSPAVALALVATGAAVTILPRGAAAFAPPGVVARPFSDLRIERTVGVVTRRGAPLSDVAEALLARIVAALAADVTHPPPRG